MNSVVDWQMRRTRLQNNGWHVVWLMYPAPEQFVAEGVKQVAGLRGWLGANAYSSGLWEGFFFACMDCGREPVCD